MNYAQNALVGYAEKGLMEAAVQRIAKGRDAALSRRVPLERRVGRKNVTKE